MSDAVEILNAAMGLNAEERAEVAHRLLLSLETETFDDDVDQAWAAEIQRRLQAIRQGDVALRDWDEALSDIRRSIAAKGQA
jgi:hypothetical protein